MVDTIAEKGIRVEPPFGNGEIVRTRQDLRNLGIKGSQLENFMRDKRLGFRSVSEDLVAVHRCAPVDYYNRPVAEDGWPQSSNDAK